MNRLRSIRMTDNLWEWMAHAAEKHERSTAEEIRVACEAWLKLTLGETIEDDREAPRQVVNGWRQPERMKEEV